MSGTEHEYLYTTIDYGPFGKPSWETEVSVHLQMDYDEIIAGVSIEVYEKGPHPELEQRNERGELA